VSKCLINPTHFFPIDCFKEDRVKEGALSQGAAVAEQYRYDV